MRFFLTLAAFLAALLVACLCLFPVLGFLIEWIHSGPSSLTVAFCYGVLCSLGIAALWLSWNIWIKLFRSLEYRGP